MTAPYFIVPKDRIRTGAPASRFPNGSYIGDAADFKLVHGTNSPDWRAIEVEFHNITTRAGEAAVKTDDGTFNIGNRRKWYRITVAGSSEESLRIGAEQMANLANALGILDDNENGNTSIPGTTLDEVIENLKSRTGTRVGFSIKNKPGKDKAGEDIMRDEVTSAWPIDD